MDPVLPQLEEETRRRRRRRMFSHARIPVRMLVPNFFTLLGLCAGLTSIRMSIEERWEFALAAIVFAALLDGIDGRIARLLKASSRFGAELDSLADFVNFGVAPAFMIFTWGLGDLKSSGWICVLVFSLASALRLARFNVAIDEDKPKWQSNYFLGVPTPAAAIVVLLPIYLEHIGLDFRSSEWMLTLVLLYTLLIAFLMVSTIPTFSGKLMGERIRREWVLPIFILAIAFVAYLVTYPYRTLTVATLAYLATIPLSYRRYYAREAEGQETSGPREDVPPAGTAAPGPAGVSRPPERAGSVGEERQGGQVVEIRASEPKR
jgi:CDP-diacylglycerol--serine O-phosphatidyltransferase